MRRTRRARRALFAIMLGLGLGPGFGVMSSVHAMPARVGDLTVRQGDVPRRLVGYGLIVGLDGTGDRSFGGAGSQTPTVKSVVNLLRRFQIEVPPEYIRARDVAAVLVTSEVSPYLRSGARFEVQVSAIGDASTLRGGTLWMTPLIENPNQPPVATAQGALYVEAPEANRGSASRRGNSGRIRQGGVIEIDPAPQIPSTMLALREPDMTTASRIATAINAAFGAKTAAVTDPGSVQLTPPAQTAQNGGVAVFLAAIDTVEVTPRATARIIIDGRDGTVVAGGAIAVGQAVISHRGITLRIGESRGAANPTAAAVNSNDTVPGIPGAPSSGSAAVDLASTALSMPANASVADIAAGLHAARASAEEIAAIFEALQAAGALSAEVVIR